MNAAAVPAGHVASVVTALEMTARPALQPVPASPLRLDRIERADPDYYRRLFHKVGDDWLWFSRLLLDDDALTAIIHDGNVGIYAIRDEHNEDVGMLELDFREPDTCELTFVGLIKALTGQGHGRWLMAQALDRAWRDDISRVWLHSCTLDHPGALQFYRKSGFMPYLRTIEIFADPRTKGHLPRDAAPHVPLIE